MATPPFTGDTSNPADNGIVAQFPTNERTHRDEIISYLDVEHDINTGYHAFQRLTTTAKNALSSPPAGMLVYDTTLGLAQINTGTSGAPVWTAVFVEPAGFIKDFAGTSAPTGYLACDGSAVSRTTYAALFAAIGTTWGAGDGSTTFNLPNFQRRSTVGSGGTGTPALANTVGSTGGEETHTLTAAESAILTYTSNVTDPGHSHVIDNVVGATGNAEVGAAGNNSGGVATHAATTGISVATSSNAGGGAHNTYHPVAVVLKVIKT